MQLWLMDVCRRRAFCGERKLLCLTSCDPLLCGNRTAQLRSTGAIVHFCPTILKAFNLDEMFTF